MRYLTYLVCSLLMASVFSEEERRQPFSIQDISIASIDVSANSENSSTRGILTNEISSQGGTITLELTSKNPLPGEIVYPIEDSNFEEIFGRK